MTEGSGREHGVEIVRLGPDRLEELKPVWQALHAHHAAVAPELQAFGVVRSAEESWRIRRQLYRQWLAEPDTFVLAAQSESTIVIGYALVTFRIGEETWSTQRVAELQTLALLPEARGRGIGRRLLEAVDAELQQTDASALSVSVIATNTRAVRFYERLAMTPFLITFLGPINRPK